MRLRVVKEAFSYDVEKEYAIYLSFTTIPIAHKNMVIVFILCRNQFSNGTAVSNIIRFILEDIDLRKKISYLA